MAPLIKEDHRYDSLDIDLENDELDHLDHMDHDNDSETTLASDGFLRKNHTKRISRYENSSRLSTILTWSRWGIIIFLQGIIIMLLLPTSGVLTEEGWNLSSLTGGTKLGGSSGGISGWDTSKTETGGDVNGLYIPTSHKYTLLTPEEEKFVPNMSTDANRMEIRKNWDMLMPLGSGSVLIPDYEQHPMLGKPIVTDPIHKGPVFEASWTHALHCLYYTVDSYHQLVISNGTKFGFEGERNDYHAAHCFEYLRNQIMCMADMTLEGSESVLDATGEGQAHMCRNREEAVKWIEERRMDDLQSIVGPSPVTEKI